MVTAAMKLKCLLLGRKVMTNLDSTLISRDITLPTNAHLVKAMVFPVVMYGCESWTVKKAERQRIDAFELWYWRRLLQSKGLSRIYFNTTVQDINSLVISFLYSSTLTSIHDYWKSHSFD